MSTVRAAQLIYTRVEPSYSPQMKSGFQTVYRSDSLSSADVNAIEKRVQCFQPNQPSLVRLQFFALDSGAIVLTNSIQLDSHPEIVDKDRRRGAFIAHCLILSQAEFSKVDYDPFVILEHYRFLDDAKDMVRTFGRASGVAPSVEIEAERRRYAPTSIWPGVEALRLVALAMQGKQQLKRGQSVLLVGGEEDIGEALRTIFFLLPKSRRLTCSFDTCVERCPVRQGLYWAVGTTTRQSGSFYIMVDVSERRVLSPVEDTLEDKDLYLAWLKHVSSQENFNSAMGQAFTVQLLANAFAVRSQPRLAELDEDTCQDFMHLHEGRVMRDLETAIAKVVGKNAAVSLIRYLRGAVEVPVLLGIAASQYLNPAKLSAIVTDWIVKERPDLKDNEWRSLQDLARQGRDMRLLHLSAVLGKKVDAGVRDEALGRMNAQTFRNALDQLMDPIAPADFVTPVHLPLLLSDSRLCSMTGKQLVGLVKAIIKANGANQLGALAKCVRSLANEPLAQLEKIIKKHSGNIPQEFQTAVITRREELGRPSSLLEFFRK